MYSLLAGYNTMTEEEKASYDIEKAAKLFWRVMLYIALVNLAGFLGCYLSNNYEYEKLIMFGTILTAVPYLLVKANSDNYKFNK